MVALNDIQNVTPKLPRIWLARETKYDQWKPLRKIDCINLNKAADAAAAADKANHYHKHVKPVLIEKGRSTADIEFGVIRYNFAVRPERKLTYGTWFIKDYMYENSDKKFLLPLNDTDAAIVEKFYQKVMHESHCMGNGLGRVLQEKIPLPGGGLPMGDKPKQQQQQQQVKPNNNADGDDSTIATTTTTTATNNNNTIEYKVVLQKSGGKYSFLMEYTGWFGKSWYLQRGYGDYTVEGELEEEMLGPVNHVIFVIHGIGEAQRSGVGSDGIHSLDRVVTRVRLNMQKQLVDQWVKKCDEAIRDDAPIPSAPNRVEFIPIFWYERLRSSSDSLMETLKATTLTTIPALREIANDLMFEVLTYLSPPFCHAVLECVTDQIIEIYSIFKKIHPGYKGTFSLIGHSLGSVICWDLLAILKDKQQQQQQKRPSNQAKQLFNEFRGGQVGGINITSNNFSSNIVYQNFSGIHHNNDDDDEDEDKKRAEIHDILLGSWGPSLPKPIERYLPFTPDFTVFLGSPLGLFLTLRGAHPIFDALRNAADKDNNNDKKLIASPFTLPCGSIHNIFHPNDPVAYRIEPLLLPQGTVNLPPTVYLTREGEGLRLHVQALHLGDNIRRSLTKTQKSISSFVTDKITDPVQRVFGKEPGERPVEEEEEPLRFPLAGGISGDGTIGTGGGGGNDGTGGDGMGRLDLQLQPPVIDNKYLAVAAAHSSYFTDPDVMDYIIGLLRRHAKRTEEEGTNRNKRAKRNSISNDTDDSNA